MKAVGWRVFAGVVVLAGAGAGCAARGAGRPARGEIEAILGQQAAAWNAGQVESFMDPYWRSADLTFSSGGHITRGWEQTLENYRRRYPSPEAMGRLSFSDLEVRTLGDDTALVLGRWDLARAEPVGGVFTLVMRKHEDRWVIVHDHTSRDGR